MEETSAEVQVSNAQLQDNGIAAEIEGQLHKATISCFAQADEQASCMTQRIVQCKCVPSNHSLCNELVLDLPDAVVTNLHHIVHKT